MEMGEVERYVVKYSEPFGRIVIVYCCVCKYTL